MKYCSHCGVSLEDSVNFCSSCGTPQTIIATKTINNPAAITTLCVLTILGSALGIIRGLFYESVVSVFSGGHGNYYMFGIISALVNLGTLTGAILMLNRKLSGYNIYMICQVIYIAVILLRIAYIPGMDEFADNNIIDAFAVFLASVFIIPSIIFMVLYTVLVKKQLVE